MRILIQRVLRAEVKVGDEVTGSIGTGLLVFVGFKIGDAAQSLRPMAEKLANLRVFEDEQGKMNLSLTDLGLSCLVVSQFTLYGDARKGNRPSFIEAERPEVAELLYNDFVKELRQLLGEKRVAEGRFRAMMKVELVNDGPVTLLIEK